MGRGSGSTHTACTASSSPLLTGRISLNQSQQSSPALSCSRERFLTLLPISPPAGQSRTRPSRTMWLLQTFLSCQSWERFKSTPVLQQHILKTLAEPAHGVGAKRTPQSFGPLPCRPEMRALPHGRHALFPKPQPTPHCLHVRASLHPGSSKMCQQAKARPNGALAQGALLPNRDEEPTQLQTLPRSICSLHCSAGPHQTAKLSLQQRPAGDSVHPIEK